MSPAVAPKAGTKSYVLAYDALRSIKMFSSAILAIDLRGPILIQHLPSYRTGGYKDGLTSTTTTSPPSI